MRTGSVVNPYEGVMNYEVPTAKLAPHFVDFDVENDIEIFDLQDLDLYADQDMAVYDPNDGIYQPQPQTDRLHAILDRVQAIVRKGGRK